MRAGRPASEMEGEGGETARRRKFQGAEGEVQGGLEREGEGGGEAARGHSGR